MAALAAEHARGLMTALSALSTASQAGPVLGALRPVIGPLVRLLDEIDTRAPDGGGGQQGSAEGGT